MKGGNYVVIYGDKEMTFGIGTKRDSNTVVMTDEEYDEYCKIRQNEMREIIGSTPRVWEWLKSKFGKLKEEVGK